MNKIIAILSISLLLYACRGSAVTADENEVPVNQTSSYRYWGRVSTIDHDSCQYIIYDNSIIHKHNCKFCKLRN